MYATRRLLTVLLFTLVCQTACAHPGHFSVSEIEWNDDSQRFEVAFRLRIPDLEDAVSAMQKKRFRIESSQNTEQLIQQYLQKHFSVRFAGHATTRFHWVGMEFEVHDVWLYFEAESVPQTPAGNSQRDSTVILNRQQTASTREGLSDKEWSSFLRGDLQRSNKGEFNENSVQTLQIRNSALMEIQPEQSNIVSFKYRNDVQTATLTAKVKTGEFSVSPLHRTSKDGATK